MTSRPLSARRRWVEAAVPCGVLLACGLAWWDLQPVPAQAKFFPGMILGLFALLSAVILVRALFFPRAAGLAEEEGQPWTFFRHVPRFLIALSGFAAFILLVEPVGFFSAGALFLAGLTVSLGFRRWRMIAVTYALFLLFIYLVFVALFERPLPKELWQRTAAAPAPAVTMIGPV